jgi:N-carbamoylputrescine amidase
VSDVFFGPGAEQRLLARLGEARERGAELALLPELPLDAWCAATREAREADAEAPGGPRHALLARAAASSNLGVVGGAIVREADGRRFNVTLAFDRTGRLVGSYRKVHLPEEPGFWETDHYSPGDQPPRVIDAFPVRLGIQVCSDVNRPVLAHALAAAGAQAILAPRATESGTWERWRLVLRALALTTTTYVLSVNRPAPEAGVPLGGPSFAVGPDGTVLVETTDPIALVTLEGDAVARARRNYPGYLAVRPALYARAWSGVS